MELSLVVSWVSILLFILSTVYVVYSTTMTRGGRMPPSPPGWPVIGHLHLMTDMPHHALAELAKIMRAPLMHVRLGSIPAVVISKPDLARAALTTNDSALASRPYLLSADLLSFGFGCSDVSLAPSGQYHRMACGLVVSELLTPRVVATHRSVRVSELHRLLALLTESASSSSSPSPVDISTCLLNMSNDLLCLVAFGRRLTHDHRLAAVLVEANNLYAGFTVGDYFPGLEPIASTVTGLRRRMNKCHADLRAMVTTIVDGHINLTGDGDREEDFVDVLLRVQKSQQGLLSDDSLMGIVLDLFLAGTDATSGAMQWVMTELLRQPRILSKAQDEVRRVVGGKGHVDESDLGQLRYLRACIKEAFRLHPLVPLLVPRESIAPCSLGGYDIPDKTRVFINTYAMGRDPEIWENPLQYSPERFLGEDLKTIEIKDHHDYKLLPFGGGRRGCPGYTFAQASVELTLASLLYHFEWALPPGVRTEDVSLEESFGLITKKKDPLWVAVTKNHQYEFKAGMPAA